MRRKTKRIIIIVIAVWAALPFIVAPLYELFADKDKAEVAEGGREKKAREQYDKPFEGSFSVEVSPDKDRHNKKRFAFFRDGTAVLQHDNNLYAVYEFYTYEPHDSTISLKGNNVVAVRGLGVGVRPERPADVTLSVRQDGDSTVMSGTEDGGGRSFILRPAGRTRYNNITAKAFDAVDFCKSDFAAEPERLWVVTATRAGAMTGKNSDKAYRYFSKGELVSGSLDDDGKYVKLPYAAGRSAYVNAEEVKHVGTQERLAALLAENGERGTSLLQWTRTFPGIEYKAATKGYFNGWRAGRKASMFFLAAAGVAAVLLLLRYFCGWDGHSWLVVSKVVLVAITLLDLWYAYSLGIGAFWFIFDNHPLAAIVNIVLMCLGALAHTTLLAETLSDIIDEKMTRSNVPKWVDYLLAIAFSVGSWYLCIRGYVSFNEWILVFYAGLMLATLPNVISLKRNAYGRSGGMVAFMLLCYPMLYVLLVFGKLMSVFKGISKTKVEVERSEPDTYWARDVDGNSVQIRKGTWGDYQGSDGRYYTRNGDTFHPNGIDNDDGPYHK